MYWKVEEPTKKEKMLIKRLGKGSAFLLFYVSSKETYSLKNFKRK